MAQAGRKGMVTIATNMAGRGTDILLGGNPEFMAKQELVKKGIAQQLRVAQGKIEGPQEDGITSIFYYNGNEYTVPTDKWTEAFNSLQRRRLTKNMMKSSPSAGCTFSAPSGTSRGASITSFVDALAARAIRDRRASISRSKMT